MKLAKNACIAGTSTHIHLPHTLKQSWLSLKQMFSRTSYHAFQSEKPSRVNNVYRPPV